MTNLLLTYVFARKVAEHFSSEILPVSKLPDVFLLWQEAYFRGFCHSVSRSVREVYTSYCATGTRALTLELCKGTQKTVQKRSNQQRNQDKVECACSCSE